MRRLVVEAFVVEVDQHRCVDFEDQHPAIGGKRAVYAEIVEADPAPASVLRQNVTSPNGTTAAALNVLMGEDGLTPLMERAVEAARLRSEELGRG